ncbi:MAG: transketolase [Gammaproteobacteria bacterium]|nr:transketolase [Gammaproteobacteria bacterium]
MRKIDLSNAVRFLSVDAVERAKSGHPGAPMGMADIAFILWTKYLKHNPNNPDWMNRDRFVLSNGHGSMLLYSLLHLTGYKLSINDIKNFRQLNSITPGHPECDITPGVETTTGPLGQGLANGVGMAIAEKSLAAEFNRPKFNIVDHMTYVFAGDGCMMEGISHEACSLAGTLGLSKLVVFYDMNNISIDGDTSLAYTENVKKRFMSYDWNVIDNVDGHNFSQIDKSIKDSIKQNSKPTLICMKTKIGFGSPNKEGTSSVHGAPLGDEESKLTRDALGWPYRPFEIPKEIYTYWNCQDKGKKLESDWNKLMSEYKSSFPILYRELNRRGSLKLNKKVSKTLLAISKDETSPIATRKCSQIVLENIGKLIPELIGGSADLKESNLTFWSESKALNKKDFTGKYVHYGVREFAMSAINNGIFLHGHFRVYASTFLIFSEYAKNAIRMSSLMHLPCLYIFTHDSIGLGEDGPTHQSVEQLSSLRLLPKMHVWRPADLHETALAWDFALSKSDGPISIVLSRQKLPQIERSKSQAIAVSKGGYVAYESRKKIDAVIISTGSELHLCIQAAKKMKSQNVNVRVVSMPCIELYMEQTASYREKIIPNIDNILAVEAGVGDCWDKFIGKRGDKLVMTSFGLSAPGDQVMEHFGFSVANVIKKTKNLIKKNRKKK